MSMHVSIDLTSVPPRVAISENPYSDADEPLWHLEIWPNAKDGSDVIDLMADSPADFEALGNAIVRAAYVATVRDQPR